MGRTIEALTQSPRKSSCPPEHAESCSSLGPTSEEELPFIEVGAPRGNVEASAGVLSSTGQVIKPLILDNPDMQGVRPRWCPSPVVLPTSEPMGVSFRATPAQPARLASPEKRFAPELIAFHNPRHPVSQQYQDLVTVLTDQLTSQGSQVLWFAAAAPRTGTTTVVLNLAITLARQGKRRVVVMDANPQNPAVASRLGLPASPGWTDILAEAKSLEQAPRETGLAGLSAVTLAPASAADVTPTALRTMAARLRESFDVIFVDAPCWDASPESAPLTSIGDAVCLVAPEPLHGSPRTQELMRRIACAHSHFLGCILTRIPSTRN